MNIEGHTLQALIAIKNLKYVGEIREDSYKRAVLHTYDAAIHLYNDGYYSVFANSLNVMYGLQRKIGKIGYLDTGVGFGVGYYDVNEPNYDFDITTHTATYIGNFHDSYFAPVILLKLGVGIAF